MLYSKLYIYIYIYIHRPSVRPVAVVVLLFVRPSRPSVSSSVQSSCRRPFSVRPSRRVRPIVVVVPLPVRPVVRSVVVVRPLCVRPVVRLLITYTISRI